MEKKEYKFNFLNRVNCSTTIKPLSNVFLFLGIATAQSALAEDWDITTGVSVFEHYNDNVFLAGSGNEEADYLTEVSPFIQITGRGGRVTVELEYQMQSVFFSRNNNENDIYHDLNAQTRTELVNDFLYFDLNAIYEQQQISSQLPVDVDNLSITSNTSDVIYTTLRPFIRTNVGTEHHTLLRYAYTNTHYNNVTGADQTEKSILFNYGTNENSIFGWRIEAFYRDSELDGGFIWDQSRAGVELSYRASGRLTLLASGGTEKNEYEQTNTEQEGSYWNVGFNSQLAPNTTLRLTGGRRFFGSTQSFNLNHQNRRWTVGINYNVDLTDNSGILQNNLENNEDILPGDQGIVNESFIRKRLSVSAVRRFSKTVLEISLFKQKRDYQISGNSDEISGGTVSWRWNFTPRTSLVLSASEEKTEFPTTNRVEILSNNQIMIEQAIGPASQIQYSIRHSERDSNLNTNEFDQNIYSIGLIYQF